MPIWDKIEDYVGCDGPFHAGYEVCALNLPGDLVPLDSAESSLNFPCSEWVTMMYDSASAGRQFNKYRNTETSEVIWTTFREDAGFNGADQGGVMGSSPHITTAKGCLIAIQQFLISDGYSLGSSGADGVCGPKTIAAIKAYECDYFGYCDWVPSNGIIWTLFDDAGLGEWHYDNFSDCLCLGNLCMNVIPSEANHPPGPVPAPCMDFDTPGPTPPDPEPPPEPPKPTPPEPTPPEPEPPTPGKGKMSLLPMLIGGGIGAVGAMLYQDRYAPGSSKLGYTAAGTTMGLVGGLLVGLAMPKKEETMAGFYRSYYRRFPPHRMIG